MNILNFIGFDSEYDKSKVALFGAPFDGTVSYRPGTRFASSSIRNESYGIETYSPYLDMDLEESFLCDLGDLEFPFGNTEKVLKMIQDQTERILKDDKVPIMIGGEHLVSYGAISACFNKYKDLQIIHFDAHTDLRDDYLGEALSHATVMRRAWDLLGDDRIFQFGIRSGTKEEFDFGKKHTFFQPFNLNGVENIHEIIKNKPVYLTIDLDVLDPSIFPGTGTPEPGGVTFNELLHGIHSLKGLNIIGADIVELAPQYDLSGVSTMVACKLLREVTLTILNKNRI